MTAFMSPSVPRVGGDEPGALHLPKEIQPVFPAWAGMNREQESKKDMSQSVPRVGGDEPGVSPPGGSPAGRVPRVGGDEPTSWVCKKRLLNVFPAWAGMNLTMSS